MKTFTDTADRTWTINLTIDAVKRVRSLLDVDLLALDEGDPPLITKLGVDVVLLCDVIFALIKPQADEQDVSDEQFGQALGGEAIMGAHTAFYDEVISFFRHLGRRDLAKAVETQRRVIDLGVKRVEMAIEKFPVEEMIEKTVGEAFTNSPGSSDSTPDPSV